MARRHSTAVPASLAAHPLGTFRPAQARHTYAHPAAEVARLHARTGPCVFAGVRKRWVGVLARQL